MTTTNNACNNIYPCYQTNVACNSNTTFTLVSNTSNYYQLTFTSSCTVAFTFPSAQCVAMNVQLINPGAYTITWTSVKWAGGTAPSSLTTTGTDQVVIWQDGNNNIYGSLIGKAFA